MLIEHTLKYYCNKMELGDELKTHRVVLICVYLTMKGFTRGIKKVIYFTADSTA
jgi:hypothetical protein